MKNKHLNGNKCHGKMNQSTVADHDIHFQEEAPTSSSPRDPQTRKKKPAKNNDLKVPALLKGRYCCNCETKKHSLINNCLHCGRIVCEQEGSGPCYVCGNLVCTPEEQIQLQGDAAKGAKLYNQLLMKEKPKGLEEALQHRDKLLDYDKNIQKHTHVFDDDSDYFCASNPWLTLDQRELVRKQEKEFFNRKYESQKFKKISLDLKGCKVVNADEKVNHNNFQERMSSLKLNDNASSNQISNKNIVDQLIDPYFADCNIKFKRTLKADYERKFKTDVTESRVLDTEVQRVVDNGYCISIHQPWASFLVHGIRTGEGRTWFTSYRGKLWIASSSSRVPRPEIEKYENSYRFIKENVNFPKDYPFGCLLGCVDLVDCLTQEQYRQEFRDGEIEDPYVFICENPEPLSIWYPIRGQPNIYKLDENIHKAAALSLKTVRDTFN